MKQKIPHSPFTTRLSGSAKETELRIRNIFQWKKKRPPVVLFLLTAVLVLSCFGLVSCQVEPTEQTDDPVVTPSPTLGESNQNAVPTPTPEDPNQDAAVTEAPPLSSEEFFSCYVTDFPVYAYTGWKTSDHNGHVFTMEDTPNNLAEAAVIEWHRLNWTEETKKLDLVCGNESLLFGSPSFFQSYTIHKLSTLPPDDFTVENMPLLEAFYRWLSKDIREFGLTEYTIVYADLSWEWTPEQLALGPQLGNGRYERLYLVGKTAPDLGWKLYEVYWGEHVFNRIYDTDEPDTPLPGEEHFVLLPVGNEISVDLNGDGRAETVLVELKQSEYGASYTLSVDHKDYTSTLQQPGIYFDSPQNEFAITDLDTGDGLLEIALPDDDPSSDPHTLFLRWDGTALHSLGEVYGKVNVRDLVFDGMGTISSSMRLSVLQTWFAPVQWRVNNVGEFGIVHQDLYYPIPIWPTQTVTALNELAAYADRDPERERTALPAGTKFTLTATDNVRWVQCADENGAPFWLRLDEESGHSVELFDGNYSWQALDGLIMAD